MSATATKSRPSNLVDENTAAKMLGIAPQTLRGRRCESNPLLSYVRVGRRILYRLSAIETFISENEVVVTSK